MNTLKTPDFIIDRSIVQTRIDDFPDTPWPIPHPETRANLWRQRCLPGISRINEGLGKKDYQTGDDTGQAVFSVGGLARAFFGEDSEAIEQDRRTLLLWLGGASALCFQNHSSLRQERDMHVRASMGLLERELMQRWIACAWRSSPNAAPPEWADALVQNICQNVVDRKGPHHQWEEIPAHWAPEDLSIPSNAQIDMLSFLYGFDKQLSKYVAAEFHPIDDAQGRETTNCCIALRILDSHTNKVDARLLKMLKKLEERFDHRSVDDDLLRLAGSGDDLKILKKEIGGEQPSMSRSPSRTRVL